MSIEEICQQVEESYRAIGVARSMAGTMHREHQEDRSIDSMYSELIDIQYRIGKLAEKLATRETAR